MADTRKPSEFPHSVWVTYTDPARDNIVKGFDELADAKADAARRNEAAKEFGIEGVYVNRARSFLG